MEIGKDYQTIMASETSLGLLGQASALIQHWAVEKKCMIEQPVPALVDLASKGHLALAVTPKDQVLATAAFTYFYSPELVEFGAWSVQPELTNHGVGLAVMTYLVKQIPLPDRLIAVCNTNSAPIFNRMGAIVMDQKAGILPKEVADPCATCNCPLADKIKAQAKGDFCVDTVMDITHIAKALREGTYGVSK